MKIPATQNKKHFTSIRGMYPVLPAGPLKYLARIPIIFYLYRGQYLTAPVQRLLTGSAYINLSLPEMQKRIAANDENAFTQLFGHFSKRLFQFAKAIVRSRELAEEVVEDVFVKLWNGRDRLPEIENLTVYLYVAIKNQALNVLSAKARELVTAPFDYLDTTMDDFANDPYDLMITSEMMAQMQHAIDALPPRCKMIFKLVREDGLKYKEVAEILNISVNTIDVQMAIAVKKICTALNIAKPVKSYQPVAANKIGG
jgi:RNA polymerase sigma-70 factor (ECF subfamily)